MFKSLKYSVTFPLTGRTLSQDLTFEGGFWAITGPNESGKSFIFEMLRFMLFGSVALRGIGDDYKNLTCSGSFLIKGQAYSVERTMKKATLWRGDDIVATGVSVVNEKLVSILGFGVLVFDMANSINQGEVERLGNLTPTERKRMVDQVLGIDALDIVSKWGMEEARLLDAQHNTLKAVMVMPTQPEIPEGYRPSAEIDLALLSDNANELAQLEGFLSANRPAPVEPHTSVQQTVAELEPLAAEASARRQKIAQIKATMQALPEKAPFTEEQLVEAEQAWAAHETYGTAMRWKQQNPRPTILLAVCQDEIPKHENLQERAQVVAKRAAIEKQIADAKLKGACTGCGLPFAHDHIAELEAQLPIVPHEGPQPVHQLAELQAASRAWATFDEDKWQEMSAVPFSEGSDIPAAKIGQYRTMILQAAQRATLTAELAEVDQPWPDYEGKLVERRAFERAQAAYAIDLAGYQSWLAERTMKQARLAELTGAREAYSEGQRARSAALEYERALETFGAAYDKYQTQVAQLAELKNTADKYRKVRQLMDVLRSLVKQHLLPSLNKVASHLLSTMTGGQRNSIMVDEDFNVIVDAQRLDTLSGSGKACANLALRIALGQVLTNRVMSVLLADEIDASMDDFRAQKTSDTLYTLEKTISQVLLVSHKYLDVPNVINIGANNGPVLAGVG